MRRGVQVFCGTLAFWAWAGAASADVCTDERVSLRGDWGQAHFNVDIADDAQERARGLMFVEQMPQSTGMLFVYEWPQRVSFWMKNTLIPLDLIFMDDSGTVRRVAHDAIPGDLTPIPGGDDILVVLEINGGLARRMGITEGAQMRHPVFDQATAVWPC